MLHSSNVAGTPVGPCGRFGRCPRPTPETWSHGHQGVLLAIGPLTVGLFRAKGTMYKDKRIDLIKLAADGVLNSHAQVESGPTPPSGHAQAPTQVALTADNLEQIPEAEQLAPGIRLGEPILGDRVEELYASPSLSSTAMHMDARNDSMDQTSVPPELDPRTSQFRPGIPSAGSVFSVAVQPGSPKSVTFDDRVHDPSHVPSLGSESVFSSRSTTPAHSTGPPSGSNSRADSISVTHSDMSNMPSDTHAMNTDAREKNSATELQHPRERVGDELNNPPLSRRQGSVIQPHRTLSTCTKIGSSPAASVTDGDKEVPSSPIPKSS